MPRQLFRLYSYHLGSRSNTTRLASNTPNTNSRTVHSPTSSQTKSHSIRPSNNLFVARPTRHYHLDRSRSPQSRPLQCLRPQSIYRNCSSSFSSPGSPFDTSSSPPAILHPPEHFQAQGLRAGDRERRIHGRLSKSHRCSRR